MILILNGVNVVEIENKHIIKHNKKLNIYLYCNFNIKIS